MIVFLKNWDRITWLVQYDIFYNGSIQQDATACLMMLIEVINKGSLPYCGVMMIITQGFLYLISCSRLWYKNILSAMYVDWDRPHLSLVVCYVLHLLIPLPCRNSYIRHSRTVLSCVRGKNAGGYGCYWGAQCRQAPIPRVACVLILINFYQRYQAL